MTTTENSIEKEIDKLVEEKLNTLSSQKKAETKEALKKITKGELTPKEAFKIDDHFLKLLYAYGYRLFQAGKFQESELIFLFLVKMDPQNVSYAKALAFAYKEQKHFNLMITAYLNWSLLERYNPIPSYYRAEALMELKEFEEAYLAYAEAALKGLSDPVYESLRQRAYFNMQCLEERISLPKVALE
jgi:predicted Zn-dependent protease